MKTILEEKNYRNMTREQRGQIIAEKYRIIKTDKGYKVPSQFGYGNYTVKINSTSEECECEDYQLRKDKCKHIHAVLFTLNTQIETDKNGNKTLTQTKTVRITYKQDWKNYNLSQQREKELFMKLLSDLTKGIIQPRYEFGRPKTQLSDAVYSMIFKVYSGYSGRRFATDMNFALGNNYISQRVPYNTMFDHFRKEELAHILNEMVRITSLPLKSIETKFSADGTGFGTSVYQRWFSYKYGKEISSKKWIKCNFINGIKTNIITAVNITSEYVHESPKFKQLVNETAENFNIGEVTGDKAYSSRNNLKAVEDVGGIPFIAFKENATARSGGAMIWNKMYHYFEYNKEEYLQHYHLRSNAETTVFMIKSKFGGSIRSKTWTSQVNESLCKVICHNIVCVISAMFELGIEPNFY